MEDQNDLARSAARVFKANVVTGGKGDKAELAAQPLPVHKGGGTRGKASAPTIPNSCPVLAAGTTGATQGFPRRDARRIKVLMLKEKRPAFRTIVGWAISILLEAGAICECEEHGWMKDRTDPQARQRAIEIARQYPPLAVSLEHATTAVESVLGSIGDTCPECPPEDG
jgi:hypothetical protein